MAYQFLSMMCNCSFGPQYPDKLIIQALVGGQFSGVGTGTDSVADLKAGQLDGPFGATLRMRKVPTDTAPVTRPPQAPVGDGRSTNVTAKGAVVSAMTLLSRLSGFARDVLLSHFLGAGGAADAFFVALRIPNFFRRLFAEGAFNQAFVPVLVSYKARGPEELKRFIALIGGNLGLVLALFVGFGIVFSEVLVGLFAPGFRSDPARFGLAAGLLRMTFPYLGFIALTAFAGAVLNAHDRYAIPAFTPVLLNVSLIAAMVLAAASGADMAFALAWGVLVAGAVQLCFQTPFMARLRLLTMPRVGARHDGVRRVGRLLVPAVLAASVGQLNSLIDTVLASTLATGSVSWLYYADRLLELPIGLVAVALGTVLLPNLSRLADNANEGGFRRTLGWGVRMGMLLGLPASVALFLLAWPLIATIFHHGEMSAMDVSMTALALRAFAIGVLPMVLVKILAPAFFAHQDTRTPFRMAAVAVAINVALNLSMFRWFGHVGLALATSVAAWVHCWLLWRGAAARAYLVARGQVRAGMRVGLAVVCMALALAAAVPSDTYWLEAPALDRILWLCGLVAVGGFIYALALIVGGLRVGDIRHRV